MKNKILFFLIMIFVIMIFSSCNQQPLDEDTDNNRTTEIYHEQLTDLDNWIFAKKVNGNNLKLVNNNYLIYENNARNIFLYNIPEDNTIVLDKNIEKDYYHFIYAEDLRVFSLLPFNGNNIKLTEWNLINKEKKEYLYHYNEENYLIEGIDTIYHNGKLYLAIVGPNDKIIVLNGEEITEITINKRFDVVRHPKPFTV